MTKYNINIEEIDNRLAKINEDLENNIKDFKSLFKKKDLFPITFWLDFMFLKIKKTSNLYIKVNIIFKVF